ncbi:MAG: class I SAM-dependent methyltransferase [Spirochaetales bacterium]|nr:class I SAM-dependent methyltransferase [Spirochaetales bacterium]
MTDWFEDWFDDNYLRLYHHRNSKDAEEQVHLIIKTLHPSKNQRILDLACGEGRHCFPFHETGYMITGIDLSPQLIQSGKRKYPDLDLRPGDMRNIKGKYDIILSLFTSFGYFDDDRENEGVIESIGRALNPGGWFWIDFLNPGYIKQNLVADNEIILEDGTKVIEKRYIENETVIKEILFSGPVSKSRYQERVKLYTKEKIRLMLSGSGINPVGIFGDYTGSPWSVTSPRTIIYGRKNND